MSQSILYYPTIDIEDSAWLRCAALYWDEVCSIVPNRAYNTFSPEILYMQERGQYSALYPEDIFVLGNPDEFSQMVRRYFFRPTNLTAYRQNRGANNRIVQLYDPSLSSLIYYEKIPQSIKRALLNGGLVCATNDGNVTATAEFATQYMRLLAEFATKYDRRNMVIGTDRQLKLDTIYPRAYSTNNNDSAISIVLEKCLPIPADDVGLEALLDFKEAHKSDLLALQSKLLEFERGLAECGEPQILKNHISAFRMTWEKVLLDSEKLYKAEHINFVLGSIESFVACGGGMAGLMQWAQQSMLPQIPHFAIGAAIGMAGVVSVGTAHRRYRDRIRENTTNGFAYLISARKSGLLSSHSPTEIL